MNLMQCIAIKNIKGRADLNLIFDDFHANCPNILVAPNGFGKSTIAKAFESLKPNKIELSSQDAYEEDLVNAPSLSLTLLGEHEGTYMADASSNTISPAISCFVINNPLYARSTSRRMGSFSTSSAELSIEKITLIEKIPTPANISYSISKIREKFGAHGKLFLNIKAAIENLDNLNDLQRSHDIIKKCIHHKKIQKTISAFMSSCPCNGSVSEIKQSISANTANAIFLNENFKTLYETVGHLKCLPHEPDSIDSLFTTIQLIAFFGDNQLEALRSLEGFIEFKEYSQYKKNFNEIISNFNTTGREIKAREDRGKLIIDFGLASKMSNGERDILSFITNLSEFKMKLKKKLAILIIDEVFDYLDGSNMLAVQYYLSEFISMCKERGTVLFPLIFTHLDPELFQNYYFKKMKIHYLIPHASYDLQCDAVKILQIREKEEAEDGDLKIDLERYFLHYHPTCKKLISEKAAMISSTFSGDSNIFRSIGYCEVMNKYLVTEDYDPIVVTIATRVKIEELLYSSLQSDEEKNNFLDTHRTSKKIELLEEMGINTPEIFHLLQPIYNDGLHLRGDGNSITKKIKSLCIKLNNIHVKKLVRIIFHQPIILSRR